MAHTMCTCTEAIVQQVKDYTLLYEFHAHTYTQPKSGQQKLKTLH